MHGHLRLCEQRAGGIPVRLQRSSGAEEQQSSGAEEQRSSVLAPLLRLLPNLVSGFWLLSSFLSSPPAVLQSDDSFFSPPPPPLPSQPPPLFVSASDVLPAAEDGKRTQSRTATSERLESLSLLSASAPPTSVLWFHVSSAGNHQRPSRQLWWLE